MCQGSLKGMVYAKAEHQGWQKKYQKYQRRLRPVWDYRRGGGRRATGLLLLFPLVAHPHRVLVHVQGLGIGLGRLGGQRMRAVDAGGGARKGKFEMATIKNNCSYLTFFGCAQDIVRKGSTSLHRKKKKRRGFFKKKCTITPFTPILTRDQACWTEQNLNGV